MKGARARLKLEFEQQKYIAWHIAALPLAEKLPDLEDFVGFKTQTQTPEQMKEVALQWQSVLKENKKP